MENIIRVIYAFRENYRRNQEALQTMIPVKEKYIVDNKGKPTSVILTKKDYDKIIEYIEELEDIAAYDRAKRDVKASASWKSVKR